MGNEAGPLGSLKYSIEGKANRDYEMWISARTSEIWVYRLLGNGSARGSLEAYSSTGVDFKASLEEFIADFFP